MFLGPVRKVGRAQSEKALVSATAEPLRTDSRGGISCFSKAEDCVSFPQKRSLGWSCLRLGGGPTIPTDLVCPLGGFWEVGKRVPSLY